MESISDQDAHHVDTQGGPGLFGGLRGEDHKYTDDEWDNIQRAVEASDPVVASTPKNLSDVGGGVVQAPSKGTNRDEKG